jgi:hypothetical protein
MALDYILDRVSSKMGLSSSVTGENTTMVKYVNSAAKQLWTKLDFPGSLQEQVFAVPGDSVIAFPPYVSELRGMREMSSLAIWNQYGMRPRYSQGNWEKQWRSWRVLGYSPVQSLPSSEGTLTITTPSVESTPPVFTILGTNSSSNYVVEILTLDSTSKTTTNVFSGITSFLKASQNSYDVTLLDVAGNVLAKMPNNYLECKCLLVDVSAFPWLSTSPVPGSNLMEVLYTLPCPILTNSTDVFAGNLVDDILVYKTLQLWAEDRGSADEAVALEQKINQLLTQFMANYEQNEINSVQFEPNKLFNIFPSANSLRRRDPRFFLGM